jgi:hypothetical protein
MRAALGAAALGGIDPAEEVALRAHLDGCPDCRAELADLESVARALPLADPSRVIMRMDEPPRELGIRVLDRVAHERARRRSQWRRRVALSAAAVVAVAAAVLGFVLLTPQGTSGTRIVFPTEAGVSGRATLHGRAAGTEVAFHVEGLQNGDYYWLWLTGDDGERIAAGTVRGTNGPIDVTMSAALPLHEARRIWVTDEHEHVVLDDHLAAS